MKCTLNYLIGEVKNEERGCGDGGNQNHQNDATKANEAPGIHQWANLENMKKYYLVFLVRPFSMVSKASENFDSVTTSTVDNVSDA